MSEPIKMPALGESVTEGTVTTWLKEVGDTIELDEPILEVSTDKVDTEVPAPAAGVLEKIVVGEDETVDVGTILGYIGDGLAISAATPAAEPAQTTAPAAPADLQTTAVQPANTGNASGLEVKMPALGESVTEGTVTTWLKQVGDEVEADEPILEVSTDKVDTEVPSPGAGVIIKILVNEDETVEVGTVLAIIGSASEIAAATPSTETLTPHANTQVSRVDAAAVPVSSTANPVPEAANTIEAINVDSAYVTPIVRKLAKDLHVDLAGITGTGVGGRIRRQDVEAAAEAAAQAAQAAKAAAQAAQAAKAAAQAAQAQAAPQAALSTAANPANVLLNAPAAAGVKSEIAKKATEAAAVRGTRQKMSGLRKTIAKRMVESLQTSAQLTTVMEVDVTRIVQLRARAKDSFFAREGVKLTYLPFFIQAATESLKAHPKLNCSIEGNEIVYHNAEHIGIAVDSPKGLFVPVIRNCGNLNIAGISKAVADLAARTRKGEIGTDELSGSTFTITNTGSIGALFDTPIINQPNVAILGTGAIFKAPAVVKDVDGNETIAIRSKCYLAISYDHRVIDGADASRYLRDVKLRLEEADFAAELGL